MHDDDGPRPNIPTLANGIAKALGEGWTTAKGVFDDQSRDAYLIAPGGERMHIRRSYQDKGRICVDEALGDLHDFAQYTDEYKACREITVAETKTAAQIAGDIKRRLLPQLLPLFKVARERKRTSDEAAARRQDFSDKLRELMGPSATPELSHERRRGWDDDEPRPTGNIRLGNWGNALHGDVTVFHDLDVQLKIRVTSQDVAFKLAERIGDLLAEEAVARDEQR